MEQDSRLIVDTTLSIKQRFPCRDSQIHQLSCFLDSQTPSPPALILYGLEATGKTTLARAVIDSHSLNHAFLKCRDYISGRHLLEETLKLCLKAAASLTDEILDHSRYARCENLTALTAHLQEILSGLGKIMLIFDDIDYLREPPTNLIPALLRLPEYIPNLTVVLIVKSIRHGALHRTGTPHIQFPSYTRQEALQIVSCDPLAIFSTPPSSSSVPSSVEQAEDDAWLWSRYCAAVWDSQAKNVARDIVSFRALAEKLWRPFVSGIVEGNFGTRDFSKLMVARRALFQSEDMLIDRVVPVQSTESDFTKLRKVANELPYISKYLLCAAYLASYNPSRTDAVHFMTSTERRKRRKKPPVGTKIAQNRKISRRLLQSLPFALERLLAIFHTILPHPARLTADTYTQLATLTSLRLLVRSGAAGGDLLDPKAKWRVNVGWEYVNALARGVGLELADWVAE